MSYRDELDAARARADALRARADVGDADAANELVRLEARIDEARGRALKVLNDVRVATPCPASWAAMVGDDHVRHCALCEKNVYDLSGLTALEAVHLLAANEHGACVRLHRRRDGTIITADCDVGRRRRRKRWLTGAVASLAIGGAVSLASAREEPPRVHARPLGESERVFDEEAFVGGPGVLDRRGPEYPVDSDVWSCLTGCVSLPEVTGITAEIEAWLTSAPAGDVSIGRIVPVPRIDPHEAERDP